MPGHHAPGIDVRRVYEDDPDGNGYRVLVDRLWPSRAQEGSGGAGRVGP